MKKFAGTIAVLLLVSSPVAAAAVRIEVKASYFQPTEQAFLDIYGGGPRYGGELSFGLWKGFDVWLGGDYFSREGELTFTKERTTVKIMPIGAGLKFKWTKGRIRLYSAAGLRSFKYTESNPIGEFRTNRMGLTAELGSYVKVAGGLLVDVFLTYSACNVEGPDFAFDIGGVGAGLGLAYEF